jgi:type I restriction enzyme S subunit
MKLKPYPKYKDSGIEWIGEIPEGWDVKKLKYVCNQYAKYGLNIGAENYQSEGIRFIRTTDLDDFGNLKDEGVYLDPALAKNYLLKDGNLLISRSGTIGRSFLYESEKNDEATYAGYLVRYCPDLKKAFPKYLFYFTLSHSFYEWLKTQLIETTIGNVNGQKYANIFLPISPKEEQIRLSNYLDQKTAKIDELIKKNEQLIELLKEKRQAVISHAVTKGIPPHPPLEKGGEGDLKMKDSGIEWIGEIPEGWSIRKLKFLSYIKLSGVDKKTLDGELPVKLCNYTDVYKNEFISEEIDFMEATATENEIAQSTLNKGDVLITKDSETPDDIAVPAYVKTEFRNVLCGYHLAQIRANSKYAVGEYLFRLFCAQSIREQFTPLSNGITRYGLSKYSIDNSIFPVPTIAEQKIISNYLDQKTAKIDELITKIQSQIEKLKEYRQALISTVTTGKVMVVNI